MSEQPQLPGGRVTFVITDIEGSTALMLERGDDCVELFIRQRELITQAAQAQGGHFFGHEGDACFCAFADPVAAIAACLAAQRALASARWPEGVKLRVRMGVHTGAAQPYADNYIALSLHQASRIAAAGHGGQVLVSMHTHHDIQDRLPAASSLRELGQYRLKDFPNPEPLFQLCHADLDDGFPALRSLGARQHNLPRAHNSFIGRAAERASLGSLLRDQGLITIVGAGGVGKTRLALEVAGDVLPHFAAGVWFVELAAAVDTETARRALAFALSVTEKPGLSLADSIAAHLEDKAILIVLDNCEHLSDAAASLALMILRSPAARVLATSREPLRLSTENLLRLVPLAVIDAQGELSDAERLFVERIQSLKPNLSLDHKAGLAIREICQRLDGVPLALELAAGRVRALSLPEIASRLRDRLALLRGGARDLSSRHQTLRATIEWSYELLSSDERHLYQRLAVFADGWDLAAAEQVCADADLPAETMPDLLMALVDKSMVSYDERFGEQRYGMLETLREFAEEKLRANDVTVLLDRYLLWAQQLAEAAVNQLNTAAGSEWMAQLLREQNNLRGALQTSYLIERPMASLKLTTALTHFWIKRGRLREGMQWADRALALPGCQGSERAPLLIGLGRLLRGSDNRRAQLSLEQALSLGIELNDVAVQLESLKQLSTIARDRGDYEAARAYLEQQAQVLTTIDDPYRRFVVDSELATLALQQGRWSEAAVALRMRLHQAESHQWQWDRARLANSLAIALIELDEYGEAFEFARQGAELFRSLNALEGQAHVLSTAGMALLRQYRPEEARRYFLESGRIAYEVGASHLAPEALERIAAAETAAGRHVPAARYAAAADALYLEVGYEREPADQQFRTRLQKHLEKALGQQIIEIQKIATMQSHRILVEGLQLSAADESGSTSHPWGAI